jgi:hypothetical protein
MIVSIVQRKSDGYVFDPNVLEVDENQIIIRLLDGEGPVIVVVYMVQQINCIKNKAGEIVEVSYHSVGICICSFLSICTTTICPYVHIIANSMITKTMLILKTRVISLPSRMVSLVVM